MATNNDGEWSVGLIVRIRQTLRETLVSVSLVSRSAMTRPVTALPARPASGESLGPNTMLRVGGSMWPGSRRASTRGEAIVSAIPATPAPAVL